MKTCCKGAINAMRRRNRRRGIALLETIVYIALFFVISGMAFAAFYRSHEQSRSLRRSADDIAASLSAGERWRSDIRAAAAAPNVSDGTLKITQRAGEITYFMRSNAVWRQSGSAKPERVLDRVVSSEFKPEQRQFAKAWHWTVELGRQRHTSGVRPLFTFTAVPRDTKAP